MATLQVRKVGRVRDRQVEVCRGAGAPAAAQEAWFLGPDVEEVWRRRVKRPSRSRSRASEPHLPVEAVVMGEPRVRRPSRGSGRASEPSPKVGGGGGEPTPSEGPLPRSPPR